MIPVIYFGYLAMMHSGNLLVDMKITNADFCLDASVITAIEGGPIVIQSSVLYGGKQEFEAYAQFGYEYEFPVGRSSVWKIKPAVSLDLFPKYVEEWCSVRTDRFYQGFAKTESEPVDLFYEAIVPGEAGCKVTCKIRVADVPNAPTSDKWRTVATLTRKIKFEVQPAMPAAINDICRRLNGRLDNPRHSEEDINLIFAHIMPNRRKEFIPLAVRLLNDPLVDAHGILLRRVLDNSTQTDQKKIMREYLFEKQPRAAASFFCYWGDDKDGRTLLPPGTFSMLRDAPNPWVRSMLYVSCARECDREWIDQLVQDLRKYKKSLSLAEIQPLLDRLDSDSFRIRSEAQRALLAMQEPALEPLKRAALDPNISVEVEAAIARVIERIENAAPSCIEQGAIDHAYGRARCNGNVEARRILELIANNGSNAAVTRQAKIYLSDILARQ